MKKNRNMYWKFYLNSLVVLVAFLLTFTACDESSANNDNQDEEIEAPITQDEDEVADFDELDKKMQELMSRKYEDENEPVKEVRVVKAEGAEKVDVNLKIGAGKLRMTGGASELMTAGFIYSDETWKPKIKYKLEGKNGFLWVEQPGNDDYEINNDDRYVWNLKFNNQIPLDFNIELGAGISEILLNNLNIDDFSMVLGIGKSEIDLRGNWKKNTTIHLVGGIGLSKIYLPQDVGVRLNIDKGFGAMDLGDLIQKSRTQYVNKLYENADIVLTINIKSGIGKIEID